MGEIKYISSLTMAILFSVAIIGFMFNYAADNDAAINLANEPLMDSYNTNVIESIENFSITDVNDSSNTFIKSTMTSGDQVTSSGGQFKVGLWSLLGGIGNMFTLARDKLFGGNAAFGIFLSALSGLMLYIGIRYLYKSWVGANPD